MSNGLSTYVNIVVEGITDKPVIMRLFDHVGLVAGHVHGEKGKGQILKSLPRYNAAAKFENWFILVDLDKDAECASKAIEIWLPKPSHEIGMHFRVAVRALEAWLMADSEHLADFLQVSPSKLPLYPDKENYPKQSLVNIARRSKSKQIREDMVPRQNASSIVGLGYAARLNEFTQKHWRPNEARQRSESLHRCMKALSELVNEEQS